MLAFACLTPDLLGEALIRVVGAAEALSRPRDRRQRPSQDPCHPSKPAATRATVVMMVSITAHHQPRRDMISFTGSTRVGKRGREVAAATVKRVTRSEDAASRARKARPVANA